RAIAQVAQLLGGSRRGGFGRGLRRQDPDQSGAALVVVVDQVVEQALLLDLDDVVDRGRRPALGAFAVAAAMAGELVDAERLVVRLRPAAHDRREGMAGGAEIPARDPAALLELDRDELAGPGEDDLIAAVEIRV